MSTDRKLLELAAKAAGYEGVADDHGIWLHITNHRNGGWYWNPLTDDGDALRLAVKLGISISFSNSTGLDVVYPTIIEVGAFAGWCPTFTETNVDDWAVATRRAVVRAAAEVGRGLRQFPTADEIHEWAGTTPKEKEV